ncbi:MAG: GcrA cell cycle regulator [Alphaproteobacteria bacterium]|nr:GcrA cell cycle regulator [Alphaproteobacteria bacterium]
MSKGWDNTALKKLKALVGKGLSTSEIGRRLGMSKNAIVGKLNRLGWNAKAGATTKDAPARKKATTTATTKTKSGAKPAVKKPAAKTPAKKAPAPKTTAKKTTGAKKTETKPAAKEKKSSSSKTSAKNLAIHQRIIQHSLEMANLKPNQCRWPIGDPDSEDFHFCGKTVFTGKPYCYEHCRLAYQFTPLKKKQ